MASQAVLMFTDEEIQEAEKQYSLFKSACAGAAAVVPEKTIYIERRGSCWWADWSHTSEARHVKSVFGSSWVPCPFMATVPARVVVKSLSALNPGYSVIAEVN